MRRHFLPLASVLAFTMAASSWAAAATSTTTSPTTTTTLFTNHPTLAQLKTAIASSVTQSAGPDYTKSVPPLLQMSNYNTDGDGITWNCYGATPTMANATTKCQWGSPTATRTILVTGDSQSAMWLEAIDWLGHVLNWKVVLFAHVGCAPWIDPNAVDFQGNPTTECRAFRTSVASIISQLKPQVIIPVGQAGTYGRGKYPSVAQLEGEMSAFVSEATAVKARIVMLTQIPQYLPGVVSADPNTCLSRRNNITSCEYPYSTLANATMVAAQNWMVSTKKAALINISPLFCTTAKCALFVNYQNVAHLVYYDNAHMNYLYTDWIRGAFVELARPTLS